MKLKYTRFGAWKLLQKREMREEKYIPKRIIA
jgi:hypothetical protein